MAICMGRENYYNNNNISAYLQYHYSLVVSRYSVGTIYCWNLTSCSYNTLQTVYWHWLIGSVSHLQIKLAIVKIFVVVFSGVCTLGFTIDQGETCIVACEGILQFSLTHAGMQTGFLQNCMWAYAWEIRLKCKPQWEQRQTRVYTGPWNILALYK